MIVINSTNINNTITSKLSPEIFEGDKRPYDV